MISSALHWIASAVLTLLALLIAIPLEAADGARSDKILEAIRNVAEPAFRAWISSVPERQIGAYGFSSLEESQRARLLTPIQFVTPQREARLVNRAEIESRLDEMATTWMVPVAVGDRIACLIIVETADDAEPEVVEQGKTYTARRLDAGIRLLRRDAPETPQDLRYLSFASPNVDLLLRRRSGEWEWLDLTGTTEAVARRLDKDEVLNLLRRIRETDLIWD